MPDTNDGPAGTVTETASPSPSTDPLPGFAEAMEAISPPEPAHGEPEGESAVETSPEPAAPEAKAETPKEEPAKAEAKPEPEPTINFDGFSDQQKATWERLHKAGVVSAEEVDRARKESMFQASWTRNHQGLAEERKALARERDEFIGKHKELFPMFLKALENDRTFEALQKLSRGEAIEGATTDDSASDLVDRKTAERIADERYERRQREAAERTAKEQREYEGKFADLKGALAQKMGDLGVDPKTMNSYITAEVAALKGADPVLHFTPEELAYRVGLRHEAETAKAELAKLRAEATQRSSKQVQASKQSLPPSRRVTNEGPSDLMSKTLREMGVTFEQVQGLGNLNGQ